MSHDPSAESPLPVRKKRLPELVTDCGSGLGNRLRVLASGLRFARRTGCRWIPVWRADDYHCNCAFDRLFTNAFGVRASLPEPLADKNAERILFSQGSPLYVDPEVPEGIERITVREENFFWLPDDRGVVWGQHGPHKMKDNPSLREELLDCFRAIAVPSEVVARRVEAFRRDMLPSAKQRSKHPLLGVHVRRGDNEWALRYVPTKLFPAAIRRTIENDPDSARAEPVLLVCSDCPESVETLVSEFGDRAVPAPSVVDPTLRGRSPGAVLEAAVSLFLLAGCDRIIRTASSTFSQAAAWIGNVRTTEVGPLEHPW